MTHKVFDLGVASQIGTYSDAIETEQNMRWLFTSGTPGLETDGKLPSDITGQTEVAWKHILRILDQAGMAVEDIVKVTQYLTRVEDIAAYAAVRKRVLGGVKPAFMLLVVPQLVRPEFLLEVEIIAAKGKN